MKHKQIPEPPKTECVDITIEAPRAFLDKVRQYMAQHPGWYSDIDEFFIEAVRVHMSR